MPFTPWRYRPPEIRPYVPWHADIQHRGRCSHSVQQQYYLPAFYAWINSISRAILGNKGVLSRLKAGKRKSSAYLLYGRADLPSPPPAFNLVPGGEVCQPACLEWWVRCVMHHCLTCICFTLMSVLLHPNWSQVSLLSFTSSFSSVYTCLLKTEILYYFMNIYLFTHLKDLFLNYKFFSPNRRWVIWSVGAGACISSRT